MYINEANKYEDSSLCRECIDDKKQIKLDLRNSDEEYIKNNMRKFVFKPCSNCRERIAYYSNNGRNGEPGSGSNRAEKKY